MRVDQVQAGAALLQHGRGLLLRLDERDDVHEEIGSLHRDQVQPQPLVHLEAAGHPGRPVGVHQRLGQLELVPPHLFAVGEELGSELRQQRDEERADHEQVALVAGRDHVGDQLHQGTRGVEAQGVAAGLGDLLAVVAADQVVAGVVGDHGDAVRAQVRLQREQGVLAGEQRLVEAHAVLLQQGAAEQLLRAERELDVGGVDVGPVERLAPHRLRRAAVDALHLAEHDVRAVLVGHGDHALQGLGAEPVVGVQEEDETAGRLGQADVARPAGGRRSSPGGSR